MTSRLGHRESCIKADIGKYDIPRLCHGIMTCQGYVIGNCVKVMS